MSDLPTELTGTWDIDSAHSTVGFSARHAVVATTRGRFTAYSGGATIDAAAPESSSIWVDIEAASVDTGNAQRDGHLRSPDFFDVENHPTIAYRSIAVKVDGDRIITTGDLTVAGKTHPVDVEWEFGGVAVEPMGGVTKTGFEGTATLNRKDWGLVWNVGLEAGGVLVSDRIKLVLEIEADKRA